MKAEVTLRFTELEKNSEYIAALNSNGSGINLISHLICCKGGTRPAKGMGSEKMWIQT